MLNAEELEEYVGYYLDETEETAEEGGARTSPSRIEGLRRDWTLLECCSVGYSARPR